MTGLSFSRIITFSFIVLIFQTGSVLALLTDTSSTLYQVSSWGPFESGNFSGVCTVNDLKELGTLGTGGYEHLDGELLALDGAVWRISHDGVVSEPLGDTEVCFATTVKFEPSISYSLNKTQEKDELLKIVNDSFLDHDTIYAYRIDGEFSKINVRSVPLQEEPYPILSEALKEQSVFNLSKVNGSIGGFWFPQWMQGVNYGGFHQHFITESHDAGGHVLNFTAENVSVSIQPIHRFTMILPDDRE